MRELLESTAQRAINYLEGLDSRAVAPSAEAVRNLTVLDEPLPQRPTPDADVLRQLDEVCSPATMGMAGPRFFGFVIGGALPVTLAANWLAGAWDQNSALYNVTPGTAHLEKVALGWLLELFGLPPTCGGGFARSQLAAPPPGQARLLQQGRDLGKPLRMAGDQDQTQLRKRRHKPLEGVQGQRFLGMLGTAGEKHDVLR